MSDRGRRSGSPGSRPDPSESVARKKAQAARKRAAARRAQERKQRSSGAGGQPPADRPQTSSSPQRPSQPRKEQTAPPEGVAIAAVLADKWRKLLVTVYPVPNPRLRMRAVIWVVGLVFLGFGASLLQTQGFEAADIRAQAREKRHIEEPIIAPRGTITDAKGKVLASSALRRDLTGDPVAAATFERQDKKQNVVYKGIPGVSEILGQELGSDPKVIEEKFRQAEKEHSRGIVLMRGITPEQHQRVREQQLPGIYSRVETTRTYPQKTTVAPLIGFVNSQGVGQGLEAQFNTQLTGRNGFIRYERSRQGERIATGDLEEQDAVPGRKIRLTIDSDIQWFAQNELAAAVRKYGALSGEITVVDVKGNILAVASYPSYDNNNLLEANKQDLTSKPFTDVYEPGSTSKVITLASVIDQNAMQAEDLVVVPPRLMRAGRPFKDAVPKGTLKLTLAGVLARSSNIGTILAGEKVSPQVRYEYLKKFGVGEPTGLDYPGESQGLLRPVEKWQADEQYTIMFGQGMAMTQLQEVSVFQTIANGGKREPLKIVDAIADSSGTMRPYKYGGASEQVVSPETARIMLGMMEGVVGPEGSAPQAAVPGYAIGGKSSTAERYSPEKKKYDGVTAGFVGIGPSRSPKFIVAVALQKPVRGKYGGDIAGPVFSRVMSYLLEQDKVAPAAKTPKPPYRVYVKDY